jgi:translation elongation factor EF-Ts
MNITKEMILELREATGMGIFDCKRALLRTEGDVELAKWLYKNYSVYDNLFRVVQKRPN